MAAMFQRELQDSALLGGYRNSHGFTSKEINQGLNHQRNTMNNASKSPGCGLKISGSRVPSSNHFSQSNHCQKPRSYSSQGNYGHSNNQNKNRATIVIEDDRERSSFPVRANSSKSNRQPTKK